MICTRCHATHDDPHRRTCADCRERDSQRRALNRKGIYPQRDGSVLVKFTGDNMKVWANAVLLAQQEHK